MTRLLEKNLLMVHRILIILIVISPYQLGVEDPDFESFDKNFLQPEADDFDAETSDNYILAQVLLLKGDSLVSGQVIKQKCDENGNPIGKSNSNPLLDTRVYKVQFADGTE